MVQQTTRNNQPVYTCAICGLSYTDKKIAEQCQAWCTRHQSCNIEIIKHALPEEGKK